MGISWPFPKLRSRRSSHLRDPLMSEVARGIDDVRKTLRWCRAHPDERLTSRYLRLAQANLCSLTLAHDLQMQGRADRAFEALKAVQWEPHEDRGDLVLHRPESGC